MKYLIIALIILLVMFIVSAKIGIKQNKEIKQYKEVIKKQGEVNNAKEEIGEKISNINNSDIESNFNNSINILHNYSKNK